MNNTSPYFHPVDDSEVGFYYCIPFTELENILVKGNRYGYYLNYEYEGENIVTSFIWATFGGLTEEDKFQNSIDEQTRVMEEYYKKQQETAEEQLETSKGIWETIKTILNLLNPFSEDFFAYKLVDILLEGLKSLFVPDAEFFSNWINDMNSYFGDRFGLLYYPIEIVIEFMTRLYNLSNSLDDNFVLTFPDLKFMNTTLIGGFSFDFNTFLSDDTFKNVYDIYLICVDVVLILGLVVLCKNTFADVFGGKFVDDVVHSAQAEEISYAKYERHQRNKERFKNGGE